MRLSFIKKINFDNNFWKLSWQFVKFGIVGFSNTLISLIIYYIFIARGVNYLFANTLGFLVSVINAFYWNNKYVFTDKTETNGKKAFIKVFMTYGGSFLLSTFLIFIMVDYLNISQWIAPIIRLIVTVPLNFIINKLWAFRK
ncbi:GtrA family protein [Clostridium butyricum]|uniref:GtrA family protein n=1 Tax=Clostridium butyricum TaxID=1492 RepID=UPI003465D25C